MLNATANGGAPFTFNIENSTFAIQHFAFPMLLRFVFFAFLLLALLGDARIFLFVMNRFVFGSHRQERSPWKWLLFAAPPVLLVLTALFWPVNQWIERLLSARIVERITPERLQEIAWSLA